MLYTFTSYSTFYELYVGLLKATIAAAVALSVLVSLDRLWKVSSYLHLCFKSWKYGWAPEKEFGFQPLPDPTKYSLVYPRVAVQLPMFNEKAVCQAIIDSACELAWPRERFCVQVKFLPFLPFVLLHPSRASIRIKIAMLLASFVELLSLHFSPKLFPRNYAWQFSHTI